MIETPGLPRVGGVAVLAIGSKGLVVNVVFFMAARTFCRTIVKAPARVAILAGSHGVHSEQWESAHVVIEGDSLRPRIRPMACITLFSELAGVEIGLGVAFGTFAGK